MHPSIPLNKLHGSKPHPQTACQLTTNASHEAPHTGIARPPTFSFQHSSAARPHMQHSRHHKCLQGHSLMQLLARVSKRIRLQLNPKSLQSNNLFDWRLFGGSCSLTLTAGVVVTSVCLLLLTFRQFLWWSGHMKCQLDHRLSKR